MSTFNFVGPCQTIHCSPGSRHDSRMSIYMAKCSREWMERREGGGEGAEGRGEKEKASCLLPSLGRTSICSEAPKLVSCVCGSAGCSRKPIFIVSNPTTIFTIETGWVIGGHRIEQVGKEIGRTIGWNGGRMHIHRSGIWGDG